jgi:hypothetical protein
LRAFSCTFNRFAQSSLGQHFLFAPLPSQVTAPFPPRWQKAASRRGAVARSASSPSLMLPLLVPYCISADIVAWESSHYAIGAVDRLPGSTIIIHRC